jgi:hypothetical protein
MFGAVRVGGCHRDRNVGLRAGLQVFVPDPQGKAFSFGDEPGGAIRVAAIALATLASALIFTFLRS